MSSAPGKPIPIEPIPCGGGCTNNDETPKMIDPAPDTIDQTVKPEPAVTWRCICGWAKTLPLRLITGSSE